MENISENRRINNFLLIGGGILFAINLLMIFFFNFNGEKSNREKVGFIILGDVNEAGWNSSHYNGIKAACAEFDMELLVRDHVAENSGQCRAAVEELADEGAGMIVLASFDYPSEVRDLMDKYSNIAFIATASNETAPNLTSSSSKMYQGRYLTGALAGMKTNSDVIGYVAAIKNSEVCRGINAFTLGVQRVNPYAKVVVMWTNAWEDDKVEAEYAERLIKEAGADVLTYHQDDAAVPNVAEKFGVDFIGYNAFFEGYSENYLTSIICHWDLLYKDIIQKYLNGELSDIRNLWTGVQDGVINLSAFSAEVTPEMQDYLRELEDELKDKDQIFSNEIYDNAGNLRCANGETIPDEELLKNIDWLVEGVEVLE